MPRGSSRSSSRSSPPPASPPPPARASPPPPARSAPSPAPAPAQSGGMLSGLGSTMAQGFAFGTGSALARQAVGAVFGGGSAPAPTPVAPQPAVAAPVVPYNGPVTCELDHREFLACLQRNAHDASNCDQYYSALQACQGRM
mmetsp:Transcript_6100/g.8507  ORF Transcript_6100/g.8507 Transcript_6100/m.8507 type:complete len:142 (+) Transcript_6100:64-489(+)|eukprot:CAMPEP_0170061446 /NCGR_PEP_ID=MMETSP0019_2-20121128/3002_1 /TAXON_ID=98059 /ORGANISM="Dinobryon sp., Strain UTEXLB2267" /LENGTH=141 /DNA_ID=CAMNT_0010267261 /DNA_START=31 /DNA_END=456 /DNA_ORIENTATION=-